MQETLSGNSKKKKCIMEIAHISNGACQQVPFVDFSLWATGWKDTKSPHTKFSFIKCCFVILFRYNKHSISLYRPSRWRDTIRTRCTRNFLYKKYFSAEDHLCSSVSGLCKNIYMKNTFDVNKKKGRETIDRT